MGLSHAIYACTELTNFKRGAEHPYVNPCMVSEVSGLYEKPLKSRQKQSFSLCAVRNPKLVCFVYKAFRGRFIRLCWTVSQFFGIDTWLLLTRTWGSPQKPYGASGVTIFILPMPSGDVSVPLVVTRHHRQVQNCWTWKYWTCWMIDPEHVLPLFKASRCQRSQNSGDGMCGTC